MPERKFNSFEEFWPHYVAEHSKSQTRKLHAVGTTAGMACAFALISKRKWKLLPLALLPAYGTAWISHFLIEKNKPATFDYPLWSFLGDYKMLGMMISGKMDEEVRRLMKDEGGRRKAEGGRMMDE